MKPLLALLILFAGLKVSAQIPAAFASPAPQPSPSPSPSPAPVAAEKPSETVPVAGPVTAPVESATQASTEPEKKAALVTISDVDFGHLSTPPQFEWGFNPFLRTPGFASIDPETDVMSPDKLELDAIIYDPEEPLAIINGKTLGVGERIDGMEVEKISPNFVVVRGEGLHFELNMPPIRESARAAEILPVPEPKEKRR